MLLCKNETEIIGMPCFTLENYGGYNNCFFWPFSASRIFFPAAFRLMLKIFSLAAKFGALGV